MSDEFGLLSLLRTILNLEWILPNSPMVVVDVLRALVLDKLRSRKERARCTMDSMLAWPGLSKYPATEHLLEKQQRNSFVDTRTVGTYLDIQGGLLVRSWKLNWTPRLTPSLEGVRQVVVCKVHCGPLLGPGQVTA